MTRTLSTLALLPMLLRVGPVWAGAEVPGTGGFQMRERSAEWGIAFRHHHGGAGQFYMIETMGSGVVVFDYDDDGDDDLFFVDSGPLPPASGVAVSHGGSVLYRNDGGRFADVTRSAGLDVTGYGMGAAAGDADGDADLDLYVTAYGRNQLFENRGDGTFRDVTALTGTGDESWSTSAAFADVDRDGDLDLYVTSYVDFAPENNPPCGLPGKGLRSYCHPDVYAGLPDRFYRNLGGLRFAAAEAEAGLDVPPGKGLGLVFGDLDGDGFADLYVANDMTPNFLFHNRGDGTFEEVALLAGAALSDVGQAEAGMGVALGDLDLDGRPDLVVTHLDRQTNAVYSNLGAPGGGLAFVDRRYGSGLAGPSIDRVGFGVVVVDLDRDGAEDVVVANGHIIHNIELWGGGEASRYRQPNQLFHNDGRGRFTPVEGAGLDVVRASRGLACGDLDGDGDLDLVITNSNDFAEVYETTAVAAGHGLEVDLRAVAGNRYGIGARIEVRNGEREQVREVKTGSSYLSQSTLTAFFGLGDATRVEALLVESSSGRLRLRDLPADRRLRIVLPERP